MHMTAFFMTVLSICLCSTLFVAMLSVLHFELVVDVGHARGLASEVLDRGPLGVRLHRAAQGDAGTDRDDLHVLRGERERTVAHDAPANGRGDGDLRLAVTLVDRGERSAAIARVLLGVVRGSGMIAGAGVDY